MLIAGCDNAVVLEHEWGTNSEALRPPFDCIIACGEFYGALQMWSECTTVVNTLWSIWLQLLVILDTQSQGYVAGFA
jgi:hypothetical protein